MESTNDNYLRQMIFGDIENVHSFLVDFLDTLKSKKEIVLVTNLSKKKVDIFKDFFNKVSTFDVLHIKRSIDVSTLKKYDKKDAFIIYLFADKLVKDLSWLAECMQLDNDVLLCCNHQNDDFIINNDMVKGALYNLIHPLWTRVYLT